MNRSQQKRQELRRRRMANDRKRLAKLAKKQRNIGEQARRELAS